MARQKLPEVGEGEEYELRPVDDLTYDLSDAEQRKIVGWKVDCFERLGFGVVEASAMAVRRDIERERVESMVRKGASLELILEIVL